MKKLSNKIIALFCSFAVMLTAVFVSGFDISASLADARISFGDRSVTITEENYRIDIALDGFRYGFYDAQGSVIAEAHSETGVLFGEIGNPSPVVSSTYEGTKNNTVSFTAQNALGQEAVINIELFEYYVRFEILPVDGGSDLESSLPEVLYSPEILVTDRKDSGNALKITGSTDNIYATVRQLTAPVKTNYVFEADLMQTSGSASVGIFAQGDDNPYNITLFFIKAGSSDVAVKRISKDSSETVTLATGTLDQPIALNQWYHLKMTVSGNSIKCFLDGKQIFDIVSAKLYTGGSCGVRADKVNCAADNIKLYDDTYVYYNLDFENLNGSTSAIDDVFVSKLGSSETEIIENTSPYIAVENALLLDGSDREALALAETAETVFSSVSADIVTYQDNFDAETSLVFGYQDAQNYWSLTATPALVEIFRTENGVKTLLGSASAALKAGTAYSLSAAYENGSILAGVNGETLVSVEAEAVSGLCGMSAKNTDASFDNFACGSASLFTFTGQNADGILLPAAGLYGFSDDAYTAIPATRFGSSSEEGGAATYTIDAQLGGGIDPMYGLGDYGAYLNTGTGVRETSNVFGVDRMTKNSFTNYDGSGARFISNFAVAPSRKFAQVLFSDTDKRVSITEERTLLGVLECENVKTLYYFFGDMYRIYGDYKDVRNKEGYEDTRPHYEMFGVGWEAFGALGWNAVQSTVTATVEDYLNAGYDLTWAVIGSGFWKGDRDGEQGTTTSFGIWDDVYEEGRTDPYDNPRFPDPAALKSFFSENNIKLLLGLRVHFKLPEVYNGVTYGGAWNPVYDGNFVTEGLDKGYFLTDPFGNVKTISAKYPTGESYARKPTAYINASNEDALAWYASLCELWGVDGFKEDTMALFDAAQDDGNFNRLLSYLLDSGTSSVMIQRNGAYSLSADILRINDSNYGTANQSFDNSPDRMPINLLSYAASGCSNTYPDIIGGTGIGSLSGTDATSQAKQKYVALNAIFDALCPSCSVGVNILNMQNEEYVDAAYNAIKWHSTYAPYIYDAALKSYETGYPVSMTPLYIAYPDDSNTYDMISSEKRQFEWLLGESLLAAPLFGTDHLTAETRDIYLPEGKWINYNTGEIYYGGTTLCNYDYQYDEMPVFVGGKGILIGEDKENKGNYFAEIFPVTSGESTYEYTCPDGVTKSVFSSENEGWSRYALVITDTTTGSTVPFTYNETNGSFRIAYEQGHSYKITGGESIGKLVSASLSSSAEKLTNGQSVQLNTTVYDDAGFEVSGCTAVYTVSDSTAAQISEDGRLTVLSDRDFSVYATLSNGTDTVVSNVLSFTVCEASLTVAGPVSSYRDDGSSLEAWTDVLGDSYSVTEAGLTYSNSDTSARGTLLLRDSGGWKDTVFEADITVDNLVSGKTIGLTGRYAAFESCYLFAYTHGTGLRYLKRNGDGTLDQQKADFTMSPGVTYRFRLEITGNVIKGYVDGVKYIEVVDENQTTSAITSGRFGVYACGMQASFSNISASTVLETSSATFNGIAVGSDKVNVTVFDANGAVYSNLTAQVITNGSYSVNTGCLATGTYTYKAAMLLPDGTTLETWGANGFSVVSDASGHVMSEWETVTAPSTLAPGIEERHCTVCPHTETREVKRLAGDLNRDGVIDGTDVMLLRKLLVGDSVEIDLEAADINGDGRINAKDAALLRKLAK